MSIKSFSRSSVHLTFTDPFLERLSCTFEESRESSPLSGSSLLCLFLTHFPICGVEVLTEVDFTEVIEPDGYLLLI